MVPDVARLEQWISEARTRTLELVADLTDRQLRVEQIPIVNPLDWEIGHVGYFQELFTLLEVDGRASLRSDSKELYDSIAIDHEVRWDLQLPPREELLAYLHAVRDAVLQRLHDVGAQMSDDEWYRHQLAVFHEDMHDEAITYTRQTMAFSAPKFSNREHATAPNAGPLSGDAAIPAGSFMLGSTEWKRGDVFKFDNEIPGKRVELVPFSMALAPVTQSEFAQFTEAGGYRTREFWSDASWRWREANRVEAPLYWRKSDGGWERRCFDSHVPLEPHRPMIHVSWYEAGAYCRWAQRRLPTEAEWEAAACGAADRSGAALDGTKRIYPWGDQPPTAARANLDWRAMGTIDVAACSDGDSAFGCRQMMGNVWEWTADTFEGFAGFEPGPYREYSYPLFGTTKVLRGGCWATRSRLIRAGYRNYYEPHRRDVWAGFRTCALR